MKIVAFSDIHGNLLALKAFIEELKSIKYDLLIFCGDIFGYYYHQDEIIDELSRLPDMIWLRGNHDQFFLDILYKKYDEKAYIEKYGHSYFDLQNKISHRCIEKMKETIASKEISVGNYKIGVFHGTPDNLLEGRLYPKDEVMNIEAYTKYNLVIMGHTHFKMNRCCNGTWLVNPGSLGQPRDGKGYGFAIIDTEKESVQFRNVSFDQVVLYAEIEKNDRDLKKLKDVLDRENA